MTPLKLDPHGLVPHGWSGVGPGDAVVAFSRRNIYKARRVSHSGRQAATYRHTHIQARRKDLKGEGCFPAIVAGLSDKGFFSHLCCQPIPSTLSLPAHCLLCVLIHPPPLAGY